MREKHWWTFEELNIAQLNSTIWKYCEENDLIEVERSAPAYVFTQDGEITAVAVSCLFEVKEVKSELEKQFK